MADLIFDGPRMLRREELRTSSWLAQVVFGQFAGDEDQIALSADEQETADVDHTYVFAHNGRLVSQIATFLTPLHIYDSRVMVGSIGGVATHPDYRGHRLASRLLAHCTQQLALGGARLMLISGGRGLYQRSGNVPSGVFANFSLKPGSLHTPSWGVSLRPAEPRDAQIFSRIYQAEPVHFERTPARFERFLQRGPSDFQAERWVVELDGQAAAYLALYVPWHYIGQPERRVRNLFEYAGSRLALAGAFSSVMAEHNFEELQAPIAWQDADLIHLLRGLGGQDTLTALPDHTIRVINFPGLMRDLEPYLQARLRPDLRRGLRFEQAGPLLGGEGEDVYTIARGPDQLALDGAAMTALVVGDASASPPALPGALAEIVPALFPLPAFAPGLDYH